MTNKFLRKRLVTTFHLRSGKSITFTCSDLKIERKADGGLASYAIEKVDGGALFYVDITQVEAITFYRKLFLWG